MPGDYVELGRSGIKISPIGIGIMQWGDVPVGDSTSPAHNEILDIYRTALEGGINFFDTAEVYGRGNSESHLGKCLRASPPENIVVASKFMPYPWRLSTGLLRKSLLQSLKRMGLSHVDLYQIHWPIPTVSISSWMDAMADLVSEGFVRAVGVSNYSTSQTRAAYEALARHRIPLASNQVKFNLLYRRPERSGLLELCKQLGVTIIAYSPLKKGMLTGKYSSKNLPTGRRALMYTRNYLARIEPLLDTLRKIGESHGGKTLGQVALNWLVLKGAVPIPGARSKAQALENCGALGWQLSGEEAAMLDQTSERINE